MILPFLPKSEPKAPSPTAKMYLNQPMIESGMLDIDGSFLEGGGQVLRTSLALSALTGKPFTIRNIRKGRANPGLQPQHLFCVKAARQLCNAQVAGAEQCSTELSFRPGRLDCHGLNIDIGTAGSCTLLMQSILIPALFSDEKVTFVVAGGTDVSWSEPYDYFENVFVPFLSQFASVSSRLISRGYYPKGGGKVQVTIQPRLHFSSFRDFEGLIDAARKSVPPMGLVRRQKILEIRGLSHASSNLKGKKVAENQLDSAVSNLEEFGCPVSIKTAYYDSLSQGSGIALWAIFQSGEWPCILGADSLGELKKSPVDVGREASHSLIREIESSACVDKYLADQLIPLMAFTGASSFSASEITDHCRTNMFVVEKFLPVKFKLDKNVISV
jgi:RNA 3'-phosphate cyclase